MPKKPVDYSKVVIYKIVCKNKDITDIYVGHTSNFTVRKNSHKSKCNNQNDKQHNLKIYSSIRENGGWENWNCVIIEPFPCKSFEEARTREDYYYNELKASLNMIHPILNLESKKITKHQHYLENKDKYIEWANEYKQRNPEKVKERKQVYQKKQYVENREKILQAAKENYQKSTLSRAENQEATYYENNKEKILAKGKETFVCKCGCETTINNKYKHFKTKTHLNYLNQAGILQTDEITDFKYF